MTKYVIPGEPTYISMAKELRDKIKTGELAPGAKLPTERQLANEWEVSGIVARQAIGVLKTEGLVQGMRGKGVFVTEQRQLTRVAPSRYRRGKATTTYVDEAKAAGQSVDKEHRTVQIQAPDDIAEQLDIAPGDPVSETEYLISMAGQPVTWSWAYEPLELTRGTPIEWPEDGEYGDFGIVDRFDKINQNVIEVEEALTIRSPEPREADKLQIPHGIPLIEVQQTFRTAERPVEVARMLFPADRYRFIYRMSIPKPAPVPPTPGMAWEVVGFGEAVEVPVDPRDP